MPNMMSETCCTAEDSYAVFTPDTCRPDTSCIPCCHQHVSCISDKIVVTATCMHLYPRVEHCLELVSVYM